MKRRNLSSVWTIWILLLWFSDLSFAQFSGSILYNYIDVSTGVPRTQIASINPDGSADQFVALPLLNPAYAAWSRNGQLLAVAGGDPARPSKLSTDVYLLRPNTGQIAKLSSFEDTAGAAGFITFYPSYLAVSPDGQKVAAGMVTYVGARSTSAPTNEFGNPVDVYDTASKISRCVSLMVFNANGSAPYLVAGGLCDDDLAHPGEGIDWSPTQDLIAYPFNTPTVFGGAGGQLNITAIFLTETTLGAADQGKRRQVTFPTGLTGGPFDTFSAAWYDDFAPAFSPDGQQIAYVRNLSVVVPGALYPLLAMPSIRIVGTNSLNDREVMTFPRGSYITRLSWSPDGKQLVFDLGQQATRNGFPLRTFDLNTVTLAKINVDGTGFTQVRGVRATWPAWQPNNTTAPRLLVKSSAGATPALTIGWTGTGTNLVLESSTMLGPQAAWTSVGISPLTTNGQSSVTVGASGKTVFFRLRQL